MEDIKPINTTFNLEESLKPLWKSTYYTGLAFDWCRRNQNQSLLLKSTRCLIILASLTLQFYYIMIHRQAPNLESFTVYGLALKR